MNNEEISKKEEIESALAAMIDDDFLETSKDLLAALGYHSDRTANFPGTAEDFIRRFPARNRSTDTEQEFLNNVESVELVFQVTSEEIAPDDQSILFEAPTFDEGYVRTFIFFAIELKDKDYSRGKYAQFTREVNKRMVMPVVVFFRVKDRLTIGFVGRRQHRLDPNRDVLEQVSLIKDIRLDDPHPAHLDILFQLSLGECAKWMAAHHEQENFDGLLAGVACPTGHLRTQQTLLQRTRQLVFLGGRSGYVPSGRGGRCRSPQRHQRDPPAHTVNFCLVHQGKRTGAGRAL